MPSIDAIAKIELYMTMEKEGVAIYDDRDGPFGVFSVYDLAEDFLDCFCDENGKIYENHRSDLNAVIKDIELTLTSLKNAL